jgi:hypothetical protein
MIQRLSFIHSVCAWQVSEHKLDPPVKLLPVLHDRHVAGSLTWLIEYFSGFATRRFEWQRKYLRLMRAMHPVGQFTGADEHESLRGVFRTMPPIMRCVKLKAYTTVRPDSSPLTTGSIATALMRVMPDAVVLTAGAHDQANQGERVRSGYARLQTHLGTKVEIETVPVLSPKQGNFA